MNGDRWKYGLWALLIGVGAMLGGVLVVGYAWPVADSKDETLTAVIGAVGTIIGAYFGLQVGGAEAETAKGQRNAEKSRADDAEQKLRAAMLLSNELAAAMPWDLAEPILEKHRPNLQ